VKNDGLNKSQRYRLKNLEGYRARKSEYARTPEQRRKRTEYMRIWREANRARHNELARESHARNKHKHVQKNRDRRLRTLYGITLAEKEAMIEWQGGRCAICKKPFKSDRSTHMDHCHTTGKLRGILCNSCNTKLGWLEDHGQAVFAYLDRTDIVW
jgi:hypothetical protein